MGLDSFWMFDFMGTVLPVVFVVIIGIALMSAGKGLLQWGRNQQQPVLTVHSIVTGRRIELKHSSTDEQSQTRTRYYVTFQVESGDRLEFDVNGSQYGQYAEGDNGRLTFQGTQFIGFDRDRGPVTFPLRQH
ncbi:DUF2500 domain-containing protein [Paenibacillus sp. JX-17]|uniref:DUF2500 domain-containing protein n=1 Tax=Paenibacillus lacisoli TaxID=3064525 RepID=A0ABT9C6H8_9BACL|nr:DUF2500 domain-containing protein [Paenibacillus sp. JX-17]MDO7904865.1 DUF2500 domain-containing protein [Paenibacillus sp. JX-17]